MQNFKAVYVPLIALVPWILLPVILFFTSIKPMKEDWTEKHSARDASRQVYNSDATYTGNWPPEWADAANPKFEAGLEDKTQDAQAFQNAKAQREQTKLEKEAELKVHTDQLDQVIDRFMVGIKRDDLDITMPDRFIYEALDRLREKEGPRLIAFLHKTYPELFFAYAGAIPAPPINLTAGSMPAVGTEGRLSWPLGIAETSMSVWGLYPDLLRFVETFPEKYDRTIQITAFALEREAFDHRGTTLMRLDITFGQYVWPSGIPFTAAAAPAAAAPGTEGMPPGMEGGSEEGGSAPEGEAPPEEAPSEEASSGE